MENTVTVDDAIKFLNEVLRLDPAVATAIVEHRFNCTEALADHPSVQVMSRPFVPSQVGLLGLLNGLFGVDEHGWGYITAEFDDNNNLVQFRRTEHKASSAA